MLQDRAQPRTTIESVRPILDRCVACHGGKTPAAGLSLASRESALKGGKSGRAILPKNATNSPVFRMVAAGKMPPGNPLSREEIEALKAWIDSGAEWGTVRDAPKRAGLDWWSLQQIKRPAIPMVKGKGWVRTTIDAFILAELEKKGLHPAPPADRATLIRRATFDLWGLPPTPEQIAAFVNDPTPNAYERVIDRLLASPHYGERWARHWLDVARFAESQGFEYDRIRDNAWRYRDYVIDSLNQDKPYDQFVREQIAGDALQNASLDAVVATGFLVAGPSDEAAKISPSPDVRGRAREEELEDMVGLVGQTFLGLTVNCARCHDHKFDPIAQRDYYRLKACLEGVRSGDRPALSAEELRIRQIERDECKQRIEAGQRQLASIEEPVRRRLLENRGLLISSEAPRPYAQWKFDAGAIDSVGAADGTLLKDAKIANGRLLLKGLAAVQTAAIKKDLYEKTLEAWVMLPDLAQHGGSAITIETEGGTQFDAIVFGERERGKWIAGSEGFQRTMDLDAAPETSGPGELIHMAVVYSADNRITVYRNGQPYAKSYAKDGANGTLRTYPAGKTHILFGLRHTGAGDYLQGEIEEARLYDRALTAKEVQASFENAPFRITEAELIAALTPKQREERRELLKLRVQFSAALRELETAPQAYAVVSTVPEPTHILIRGDLQNLGETVTPGGIGSLRACQADFGLAADSSEPQRRLKLAEWVTDPRNPLTPRVIVNRIWHHHFGRGIAGTPNDFGFNGELPTHPHLLDWLATDFVNHGSSLKRLHGTIMLSSAYRQSSRFDPKAAAIDSEDRLLWRFAPRRMEGEAVRDAMLAVSGQLNPKMGGPGFRPFTVSNFNSDFYALTDPDGPEYNRRSIYRINVHSARNPLLESLDCPDPSTKTPRRTVTTTPLQALELMNNSFVLRQARCMAERVAKEAGPSPAAQIARSYSLALGRPATIVESNRAASLVKQHGLESFCWTLLNATEFLYVR